MNPLAKELNEQIRKSSPDAFELLSERGRALYFPRGILTQTAEAKEKAHRFNASIGVATEGHAPMALPSILEHLRDIDPRDAVTYAPASGKPELRAAWREKLEAENPTLRGKAFGVPIVTSAITHGLALVGDLFVDPGDRMVLPNHLWGNYRLTYEVRLGAKIETFPTYDDAGLFNVAGLRATLDSGPEKQILLLNFPNNPTGYMPGRREVEGIRDAIAAAAEGGKRILAITDDAYFGLNYDDHALAESPFGYLADVHPRVLTLKLDAATKELFVWGLRCGFLTFAAPAGVADPDPLLSALERKTMGAIRGGISNSPHISQSLVLAALRSPTIDAERKQKLDVLTARAHKVRDVVHRDVYKESWDVYPFNAGYFMCIRVKGVDAEALRVHLLDKYGVGLISIGATDIRVALSCLEVDEIEPMFQIVHEAIQELKAS